MSSKYIYMFLTWPFILYKFLTTSNRQTCTRAIAQDKVWIELVGTFHNDFRESKDNSIRERLKQNKIIPWLKLTPPYTNFPLTQNSI